METTPNLSGVTHLIGPSPWERYPWFEASLEPFCNLQTLLIDTPAFPYPVPHDINLEEFADAHELAIFLTTYNLLPHENSAFARASRAVPGLRRFYLQYLHWQPLGLTWEDPAGGTGEGRNFYTFRSPDNVLIIGRNELDHYDGQMHDLEPFSLRIGPYQPDPNWPDSSPSYERPR
ncbi:hypothetical protein OH77DRAFT_1525833 [Trametes cingulata]|nr:hypothetical protein OH77DRAFT_1525833 [Trametes cingulata]